ncbi:biosynthetic peptidoglycan transglycosylase [Mucilaginibacter sp. AW1-3]
MSKLSYLKDLLHIFYLIISALFISKFRRAKTTIWSERKLNHLLKKRFNIHVYIHSVKLNFHGEVRIKRATFFFKNSRLSFYRSDFTLGQIAYLLFIPNKGAAINNFKKLIAKALAYSFSSSSQNDIFTTLSFDNITTTFKQLKTAKKKVSAKVWQQKLFIEKMVFKNEMMQLACSSAKFCPGNFSITFSYVSCFLAKNPSITISNSFLGKFLINRNLRVCELTIDLNDFTTPSSTSVCTAKFTAKNLITRDALNKDFRIDAFGFAATLDSERNHLECNIYIMNYSKWTFHLDIQYYSSGLITMDFKGDKFVIYDFIEVIDDLVFKAYYKKMFSDISVGFNGKFVFDFNNINQVLFDFSFDGKFNRIVIPEICKIQNDFGYILDLPDGKKKHSFLSKSSKNFTPIESVPQILRDVVILSEDKSFFEHRGINRNAIGKAILYNLFKRAVKKGGSTITMQVVKNIFLTNDRKLSRKVDELIVANYIENDLLISKMRILEIYMNIIPFAPNVFGIKEGAAFYFDKDVNTLTLVECIVLSYIIPRPLYFMSALLENSSQLRTNLRSHIIITANILKRNSHYQIDVAELISKPIKIKKINLNLL